jgi:molybdopterin synthase sulfur carrier subunit
MPKVEVARHLYRFFPVLQDREIVVPGSTAAEVVQAMNQVAPGFSDYVVDERGALRQHVNLFIDQERVVDRRGLTDKVPAEACVYIFQALSGG